MSQISMRAVVGKRRPVPLFFLVLLVVLLIMLMVGASRLAIHEEEQHLLEPKIEQQLASASPTTTTTTTTITTATATTTTNTAQILSDFTARKWEITMTPDEVALFLRVTSQATSLFEWGSGGSTLFAAFFPNLRRIVSVDGLLAFQQRIASLLTQAQAPIQVEFVYVDIDANPLDWSRPTWRPGGYTKRNDWPKYSQAILAYPPGSFDLILVDGRFRMACAFQAWKVMTSPSARLLLHDCQRRPYGVVEHGFELVERVHTLCLYQKKPQFANAEGKAREFEFNFY
jgi:hypothetical protein